MKYYILVFTFITFGCVEFQQVQLPQSEPVNSKLSVGTVPASNILLINNTGIIDDFKGSENLWKDTSKAIFSDVLEGQLRIHALNAGDSSDFIYRKFNPLNFSDANAIAIPFKITGEGFNHLQLTLIDEEGYQNIFIPEPESSDTIIYSIQELNRKNYLSRINEIQLRIISDSLFTGEITLDHIKALK